MFYDLLDAFFSVFAVDFHSWNGDGVCLSFNGGDVEVFDGDDLNGEAGEVFSDGDGADDFNGSGFLVKGEGLGDALFLVGCLNEGLEGCPRGFCCLREGQGEVIGGCKLSGGQCGGVFS